MLAVSLLVAGLGLRRRHVEWDQVEGSSAGGRMVRLASTRKGVLICVASPWPQHNRWTRSSSREFDLLRNGRYGVGLNGPLREHLWSNVLVYDGPGSAVPPLGPAEPRWHRHRRSHAAHIRFLGASHALASAITALPASAWGSLAWRRRWKARRAQRLGLCPGCGYDRRHSPDRCPECGRPGGLPDRPHRGPKAESRTPES